MFSLLWSEHCAYKHSRKLLGRLPTEGERVVMGPGENAGAVDVGNGHAVAFKVESHNHPSAVEPFQGAATGVGGILRDVFAIGARPIAVLDSLRFGELSSERSRYLFEGAVAGIGHYGNSIGVPTVGGEVYFEPPYEHNCLVNAMCVGLARTERDDPLGGRRAREPAGDHGRLDRARRDRRSVGARLGRAGGRRRLEAAERPDRRPVRGVEAARVLPGAARARAAGLAPGPRRGRADLLGRRDGLQGRGRDRHRRGAGAPARAGPGAVRDDDLRVAGADAGGGRAVRSSTRWSRPASAGRPASAAIGEVTDSGRLRVLDDGVEVGDVPVAALVDECPLYDLEPEEPVGWMYGNEETPRRAVALSAGRSADPSDPSAILCALLASPNVASKRWAFEQYDSVVGSRTARRPGGRRRRGADAARVRPGDRGRDRRQRAAGRLRPVRGDGRGGARVRPEPRLRRRRAARPDQLPQLRQPGEAERRLAARPGRTRPGRRLPRARGARSSAATSPSTTRPSTARSTRRPVVGMVGELPDPATGARARAARGRPARPGRAVRALAGRLRAREAARGARRRAAAGRRSARWPRRSRSFGEPCPRRRGLRRPRRQRRRARLRAGRDGDRRRGRHRGGPRSAGRAARRLRRELPVRRGARRDRPRGSADRDATALLEAAGEAGVEASSSARSAASGSRSRPPSGTSRWRWPTPSGLALARRSGSDRTD